MPAFQIPSGRVVIRAAVMTALSLIVLKMIGGFVPQLRTVPIVGAVFQ